MSGFMCVQSFFTTDLIVAASAVTRPFIASHFACIDRKGFLPRNIDREFPGSGQFHWKKEALLCTDRSIGKIGIECRPHSAPRLMED